MPKFNYTNLRNTAIRLIDKFGRTATRRAITKTAGTTYNPVQTNTDTSIVGAFIKYSTSETDGTLIKAADKKLLAYDEILLSDIIIDGIIEYSVISVDPINPGDTKLIYKVQLRAA